jgi:uncharacterized NAD(P)/FAD-binding protein YdhS
MASPITTRIAIIGAGFSGSLLAVQLLRRFAPNARVYLIEKTAQFGRGLAYATGNPGHLLNVRAGRMSAFADDPDHFLRWLARTPDAARLAPIGPESFVPRRLYGAYIQSLLGDEIWQTGKGRNLYLVNDEAVAIHTRVGGLAIEMRGGWRYDVEAAVLAVGNFPNEDVAAHTYGNPWSARALAGLAAHAPVLLMGSGLTMVDTAISLVDQGHRGPITALSRRGLLPRRHGPVEPHRGFAELTLARPGLASLLRGVRREIAAAGGGESWRSVMDALRPFTTELWTALSAADKQRFLRHLRPWWEVHRHRMAPAVADAIAGLVARGQLSVVAGRIKAMVPDANGVTLAVRRRGRAADETLRVARIIDCSGPQYDFARIDSALVRGLLVHGTARADPLGLGLAVTRDGAVIDRWDVASRRIYALGPVTRGTFWEITSVPDIREQCWALASLLERRLAAGALESLEAPPLTAVPRARHGARGWSFAGRG